ncbi:hypothetical protein LIER_31912 [Lithospermum erythrorhizon]|uniref:Uncharacterized protein n=1 Tax=Lithospermum erythrorhizon TaxID=34254 RepID=A0AAV3RW09_LITER
MRSLCDLRDMLVAAFGGRAEAIEGLEGCCVGDKLVSKLIYEKLCTYRVKKPWMSAIWKGFIPPKYSFVVCLTCRDSMEGHHRLAWYSEGYVHYRWLDQVDTEVAQRRSSSFQDDQACFLLCNVHDMVGS